MQTIHGIALKLMDISEAAFLTTLTPEGLPETRAMLNLRNAGLFPGLAGIFQKHPEDPLVYFTTNVSSSKFAQIKNNPNVCVYYCQPTIWQGLLLSGQLEIVTDPATKQSFWQPGWEMYYPQGPTDPDYALLCLKPKTGKLYNQLHVDVLEWKQRR
jgi:general stress protein 26